MSTNTCIAITPGEPSGIGPEITLKLATRSLDYEIVSIANMQMLQDQAKHFGIDIQLEKFDETAENSFHHPGTLKVIDVELPNATTFGKLDKSNSQYVVTTLNTAVKLVQTNALQALTTGPVQKSILNDAGITFSGHTEFIANMTGGYPVMMLANEKLDPKTNSYLRVALVTTHLPISQVTKHIDADVIEKVITILNTDLINRFGVHEPKIVVCGLNPHAGEGGHLGHEETKIIIPVLDKLRSQGLCIEGPLPADSAFTQHQLSGKDAIVAMYHDQGLPVIKHQGFGEVVNVTLGLPIIRTSVDHGTALDLAGTGTADESSLVAASNLAATLFRKSIS